MDQLGSVVVVGAGLAGAQAVAALRDQGFSGRITVLGREGLAPYDRPPLSKELFARDAPADLVGEIGVDVGALADDVRLGSSASRLEVGTDSVRVHVASGAARADGGDGGDGGDDIVAADAVVVAVGSRPIVPPGWDEALVLHTWPDAERLRARLVPGARLVCIGAGWIGAEVSGAAAVAGCEVVVVEAAATPLERQLGPDVGRHLAPWYAEAGVDLRLEAAVTAVRGRRGEDGGSASASGGEVELASGEVLAGDVVLAAVGARPWTDWLRGTLPMDARGSLHGDPVGRVIPRVYAVGDCVTRHGTPFGDVPGGHWSAALHDPATTVAALLEDARGASGATAVGATPAPYVFSRQLGHDLALFGSPTAFDEVVLRGLPGHDDGWTALYLATDTVDDGVGREVTGGGTGAGTGPVRPGRVARLTGLLVVDAPREVGAARRLLRSGFPLLDVDAAVDVSHPLRAAVAG